MLSCKQVTRMVAGEDLADAGLWLRMKVRFHLMMCRHCAHYNEQIRMMGTTVRERFGGTDEPSDVDDLQQRILGATGRPKNDHEPS
jgi:hypothetical protein